MNKYVLSGNLFFFILMLSYILPLIIGENTLGIYIFFLSIPIFLTILIFNPNGFLPLSFKIFVVFFITFLMTRLSHRIINVNYFIVDYIGFYIVFALPTFINPPKVKDLYPYFKSVSIFTVVLYLLLIPFDSFWDNGRYAGFTHNINMSVYIISFSLIFLWFYYRSRFSQIFFFKSSLSLFFIFLLLLFMILSGSRSYGFAILFFLATLAKDLIRQAHWLFKILFILSAIIVVNIVTLDIFDNARIFSNDASMLTRLELQSILYSKALSSYGIPLGPNYTTLYIQDFTGSEVIHAHNDFLNYFLNYGIFFCFGIYCFIRSISLHVKLKDVETFFLLILFFSTALHGYLTLYIFMIPLFMIISVKKAIDFS